MSEVSVSTPQLITWKERWKSPRGLTVLIICAAYVALPAILPMYQLYSLSPWGSSEGSFLPILIFVCSLFALPALLISGFIGLPFPAVRQQGIVLLLTAFLFVLSSVVCYVAMDRLRMAAFASLADRSTSLIQAIKTFQTDTGAPPETLDSLVPNYIAHVPDTGIGRYPKYDYQLNPERINAPWMLSVNTPHDFAIWSRDLLFYLPDENYDEYPWSNEVTQIRDWGYARLDD